MDVPISLAVLLTLGLSLFETARGGEHAFFDAAVTLLFFLLVGRYLDCLMRDRARSAVAGLARLGAKGATRRPRATGAPDYVPLDAIEPGMMLRVEAGERMPVDVRVRARRVRRRPLAGHRRVGAGARSGRGDELEAGTLNLTGAIDAVVLRPARQSFLAEMVQMLEARRGGARQLRADRRPGGAALCAGRAPRWRRRPSSAGWSRRAATGARRSSSRSRC